LLLCLRHSPALAAENLFLRKQLTLYQERQTTPRHATNTMRFALVWLSRWFDWQQALRVVQPETLTRWHRQGFRLLWRWKSKPGRPRIPVDLQALIRHMACDNPTWGQERIANELLLKLGLRVLKTPPRAPQDNAICERLLGTLRRECLDFLIPLTANHLRHLLHEWLWHYNAGRLHMSLGPGIPQPPVSLPAALQEHRYRTSEHQHVVANPILGGLHHNYRLEEKAA
jgi:transposase InsO family protein